MAKEINPRLVFERLFAGQLAGESAEARAKRERYRMSILDFVAEDARQLQGKLGQVDRRKLDEYLTSVRELEAPARPGREGRRPSTSTGRPPGRPASPRTTASTSA